MGKITTTISFNKEFLNKLKNDSNACVEIHRQTYHLALQPYHLIDLNLSIKELLNEKIAKYDSRFEGILLGFQNIRLLQNVGAINFDNSFLHANIDADFYIFKPIVGKILNGVVNKKSKGHVGCLVHKTFNISLPKPENDENWIGQSIQLGQEIQFEIIFTDLNGKLPYIRGKILSVLSDDSGFSTSEEPNTSECQLNKVTKFEDSDSESYHIKKEKKKRKRESSTCGDERELTLKKVKLEEEENINETPITHKKHKHKKNKYVYENCQAFEYNNEVLDDSSINNVSVKKTKKAKKHKTGSEGSLDMDDCFVNKEKRRKHKHREEPFSDTEADLTLHVKKKKKKK